MRSIGPDAVDSIERYEAVVIGRRAATNAIDHRIFAGRLVRSDLSIGERIAVKAVGAAYGDFRSWMDIAEWAEGIAAQLQPTPARAG